MALSFISPNGNWLHNSSSFGVHLRPPTALLKGSRQGSLSRVEASVVVWSCVDLSLKAVMSYTAWAAYPPVRVCFLICK